MSKVKYYYDSETLSYKEVKRSKKTTFKYISLFVISSGCFALLFVIIGGLYFQSPKEKSLERELTNLLFQYDILTKKIDNAYQVLENVEQRDNNLYRHYFETNPIPEEQRRAGFGGINRYKKYEGYDNSQLVIESAKRIDILEKAIVVQSKSLDEIATLAKNKEQLLSAIPAIQPIKNSDLTRMASGFGWRRDPFTKARKFHKGMDFTAKRGTPVYASGDGKITRADSRSSGYGKHIRIDHGYGYVSLYAHLNGYNVRRGQKVKRGDVIGFVGSTGRSQALTYIMKLPKMEEKSIPLIFITVI